MRITFLEEFDNNMEIDNYLKQHPTYSVDRFGFLKKDDSRFQKLFKQLEKWGYNPREVTMQKLGDSFDGIEIDSGANRVPGRILNYIDNKIEHASDWIVYPHTGPERNNLQFNLQDDEYFKYLIKTL